jgi:hypothetical protein
MVYVGIGVLGNDAVGCRASRLPDEVALTERLAKQAMLRSFVIPRLGHAQRPTLWALAGATMDDRR